MMSRGNNGSNSNNTFNSNNSRFNSQFCNNPHVSYLQNSVPFHPMHQYFSQPPMSVPYGVPYSSLQGVVPHNNYHSLPVYNDRLNSFNHSNNTVMDRPNWTYNNPDVKESTVLKNSHFMSAPSLESTSLKPSSQDFIPQWNESTQGLPSGESKSLSTEKYTVNNSEKNTSFENGTRPKEFYENKKWGNKKSSFPKSNSNWQSKENNRSYENYVAEKNGCVVYPDHRPSFVPSNCDYPDMKGKKNGAKSYARSQNESSMYLDSKNPKPNTFQKRQNFYPKRQEWRNSNNEVYENYNYYGDGRNNYYHPNNYNNRGGKRYSYPNVDMRENKYGQPKQKEIQDRYSRSYYQNVGSKQNINQTENLSPEKEKSPETDFVVKEIKIISNGDEKLQRETMIENLSKGIYECMVCCDRIRQQQATWSCEKCYNCFHLGCIKKWAEASQGEPGWRCPACQNQSLKMPTGYFCFCKKLREPEWNRREVPHSCGEVCGRKRENEWCVHKCTILCHPGPCPDCTAFIRRQCQCGKNFKDLRCSHAEPYLCGEVCGKPLNCLVHTCQNSCHNEACEPCSVTLEKECFCGKEKRKEKCTETAGGVGFSCDAVCNKTLSCGYHTCDQICHEGDCYDCSRAVEIIITCPCGKMNLKQYYETNNKTERKSCADPIPTCGKICGKVLKCGTPGVYHRCKSLCHEGSCPLCDDMTDVKCRCGCMDKTIPCSELFTKADEVTCEKQCKKFRQCGRHKCGTKCCIDIDHICIRICGRLLKCRQHKCQEPCHRGLCPRCWETSFEELKCHCGASVLYPPIPCGTKPPACDLPCQREQSCSHAVAHTCHVEAKCPPCTTLIEKPCCGSHTIMKSTPCYVPAMSCGEQCGKRLPCGVHLCKKVCHEGSCVKGSSCTQKCTNPRTTCDHPCGKSCHKGPCPNTPCKEMVTVTCLCGIRKVEMVCSDNEKEYKSMATSKLASELHSLNSGGSVNISEIFSRSNKTERLKRLECNNDCRLAARNRQLALALQITNPDAREFLNEGGANLYADSVKSEAKKDIQFAHMVHDALSELVLKARQSKQKSRSHSFAPMNGDKRRFIHEYSKYFGCQSQSYDEEPKKNVVVTAFKVGSRLPPTSVIAVVQKEQGQRKVPGPVLSRKALANEESGTQMKRLEKTSSFEKKESPPKEQNVIDYFDFS